MYIDRYYSRLMDYEADLGRIVAVRAEKKIFLFFVHVPQATIWFNSYADRLS